MPSASGPVTAVFDGHTFTSPTVYLSFDYLSTELDLPLTANTSLAAPGVILTNVLVPIASTSVSTIYWNDTNFYTASMDWSNLNAPVPYLAYNQGRIGWNGETSTSTVMYPDDFAPYLSLPSTILSLVSGWSRCSLNDDGVWDPPHALQPAADPAKPVDTFTSVEASTSTNAPVPAPGPSVGSFEPTSTESPRMTPHSGPTANSQTVDPSIVSLGKSAPAKSATGSSPEISDPNAGSVPFLSSSNRSPSKNGNGEAPAPAPAPASNNDRSHVSETATSQDPGDGAARTIPSVSEAGPGGSLRSSLGAYGSTTGSSLGEVIASVLGWSQNDGNSGSRTASLDSGGEHPDTEVSGQTGASKGNQKPASLNGGLSSSGSKFEGESTSAFAPQRLDSGANAGSTAANLVGSSGDDIPQGARFTLTDGRVFTPSMVPDHSDLMAIGGQTLRIGGDAKTIDGNTFSATSDGVVLISGSQTSTRALFSQATSAALRAQGLATFTGTDGSTVTAVADPQNQHIVVGGRTISPGDPAVTVDGNALSAMSNGLVVIHGIHTRVFAFPNLLPEETVFTAPDGSVITAYSALGGNRDVIVNGQTLSEGGPAVTIHGQTVSAGSHALVVNDGSHTQVVHFSSSQQGQDVFTAPDGKVVTAYNAATSSGAVVIDGHTVSVGDPALTVDGESMSDSPNGLVIEDTMSKSTVALQTRETTAATVPTTTGAETNNVGTVSTPVAASGVGRSLASNIACTILLAAFALAVSHH
ncbi:MAG: hypothetical protein M1822_003265 [Bathelium mastoideum]|nr:MAG: hypothetical protein M1822_003265 [Bathelium mastoideum]